MKGQYFYVPEDVATTPRSGDCLVDHWWSIHPEKGLAFYFVPYGYLVSEEPSPQCNASQHIAEYLTKKLHPECAVRQIPVVFLSHAQRTMRRLQKEARDERDRLKRTPT